MIRHLFSSAATFSPADVPGSDAGGEVVDNIDTNAGESEAIAPEPSESPEPAHAAVAKEDHAKPRVESTTDSIKRAVAETKEKAEAAEKSAKAKKSKTSSHADGAAAGDTAAKTTSEDGGTAQTDLSPKATDGPPTSWTAVEKQLWTQLPDAVKAAVSRHEQNTIKGVADLKTRYQDIDTAVAPFKAVMTQNNVTPAQAISQLFKWHMELAGPNKVQAFQQLAKSFGIDPATIAAPATQAEPQAGADQGNAIPENLRPVITDLETRIKSFEEQNAAQARTAAQQTWTNWSKDKPHAEKVRGLMANLINSDLALIQAGQPQISNTINPQSMAIDMDAAYQAATYAHPEVRAALMQEEQGRRDKETRTAAERAKKAGASMRSGAPAGTVTSNQSNTPRIETPRESIARALAELRGTQH